MIHGDGSDGQSVLHLAHLPDEAFPALVETSTVRADQSPSVLSNQAPISGQIDVDYSSLAERLASESASALAASQHDGSGANNPDAPRELRLSVLSGFGEARPDRADRGVEDVEHTAADRGAKAARSLSPDEADPDASGELTQTESRGGGGKVVEDMRPDRKRILPPPSPTRTSGTTRPRLGKLATAALRQRLRERWFRLDAERKAERQRQDAERRLVALEDGLTLARNPPGDDRAGSGDDLSEEHSRGESEHGQGLGRDGDDLPRLIDPSVDGLVSGRVENDENDETLPDVDEVATATRSPLPEPRAGETASTLPLPPPSVGSVSAGTVAAGASGTASLAAPRREISLSGAAAIRRAEMEAQRLSIPVAPSPAKAQTPPSRHGDASTQELAGVFLGSKTSAGNSRARSGVYRGSPGAGEDSRAWDGGSDGEGPSDDEDADRHGEARGDDNGRGRAERSSNPTEGASGYGVGAGKGTDDKDDKDRVGGDYTVAKGGAFGAREACSMWPSGPESGHDWCPVGGRWGKVYSIPRMSVWVTGRKCDC